MTIVGEKEKSIMKLKTNKFRIFLVYFPKSPKNIWAVGVENQRKCVLPRAGEKENTHTLVRFDSSDFFFSQQTK